MAEEKEKLESIIKFYFQARWQTALSVHFLIAAFYLSLFFASNLWIAFKFAFFSIIESAHLLGLEFAFWAVVFELTVMVPFFASWYAIFLLPKIWRSKYSRANKVFFTILMVVLIPIIIYITDSISRMALNSDILREFTVFHDIEL